MNKEQSKYKHVGINQKQRARPALDPSYVSLDERSFTDLVLFGTRYASIINYFNLNNKPDGNWQSFFLSDPSVYLCSVSAIDIRSQANANKRLVEKLKIEKNKISKLSGFERLNNAIYQQALQMNEWYTFYESKDIDNSFCHNLSTLIARRLSQDLNLFVSYQKAAVDAGLLDDSYLFNYQQFNRVWNIFTPFQPADIFDPSLGDIENIDKVLPLFEDILWAFDGARKKLIQEAQRIWQGELTKRHDVKPDLALFLTFLDLFKLYQKEINQFTGRHLDFYYQKALNTSASPGLADQAFLYATLKKGFSFTELKTGTQFSAGKTLDGTAILFETEEDNILTNVQLVAVNTLFLAQNSIQNTGTDPDLISGIYQASITLQENGSSKDGNSWPTFGEDGFGLDASNSIQQFSTLGFALASPSLFLEQGNRKVELDFTFESSSYAQFTTLLEDIAKVKGQSTGLVFYQMLSDAFEIYLSSDKKWFQISNYDITYLSESNSIGLQFQLEEGDPAIVGYDQSKLKEDFDTNLPLLKILLNNDGSSYAYSLVAGLLISEVNIRTNVDGLRNLSVATDVSKVNTSKPFQPFAPSPINVGSSLLIGSAEVFGKEIKGMSISVEWANLPDNSEGFKGYYSAYDPTIAGIDLEPTIDIANDSFKVSISALNSGEWETQEDQSFDLFSFESPDSPLEPSTVFEIDPTAIPIVPDYNLKAPLTYTALSNSGFIRLELTEPSYAFAQTPYLTINAQVALQNAKTKKGKPLLPVPNPPYVPKVKSVSCSYQSSDTINWKNINTEEQDLSPAAFFHIGPFCNYPNTFLAGQGDTQLQQQGHWFPFFQNEGHLLLGFKELQAQQPLSLLFQLADGKLSHTLTEPIVINWFHLLKDQWVAINDNILSDGTESFSQSGIVKLETAAEIDDNNTVMPGGYYWIKAEVQARAEILNPTQAINLNGFTVTRILSSTDENIDLNKPLPANSIKALVKANVAVDKVVQPLDSIGGQSAEDNSAYYQRISERLRHKQRAISPWDFENIVLSRFPQVFAASCISHRSTTKDPAPGHVLLALIPNTQILQQSDIYEPRLSISILNEVQEFIEPIQSGFTELEVTNPQYEIVTVRCSVQFEQGQDAGQCLKLLNQTLCSLISPWINGDIAKLTIAGTLYSNKVINTIEKLPYVKFVTAFSMLQIVQSNNEYKLVDTAASDSEDGVLKATSPWSVLTSARQHEITVIDTESVEEPKPVGVGSLIVGDDFIIS